MYGLTLLLDAAATLLALEVGSTVAQADQLPEAPGAVVAEVDALTLLAVEADMEPDALLAQLFQPSLDEALVLAWTDEADAVVETTCQTFHPSVVAEALPEPLLEVNVTVTGTVTVTLVPMLHDSGTLVV